MQRQRVELVPVAEALADLPGPVQALIPSPPTQRHFTRADQVNQLASASEADPDLGFMARMMVLCSLPRTNPGNRHQYKRVNGPYKLIMSVTGDHKLPFGNLPRLLLAWVCTEAVKTGSRELVLGKSLSDFMRTLDIYAGGGNAHTKLRNQMKRLFYSQIVLVYKDAHGERFVNSPIADSGEFWWDAKHPSQASLWESKIQLGERFFHEIVTNPLPINMKILKAMKRSPLGLDLYLWLTYRMFNLKRPLRLTWRHLYRQLGADQARSGDKNTVNAFRTDCLRELKKIKDAWPDLHYQTVAGALLLSPSPPCIAPSQLRLVDAG